MKFAWTLTLRALTGRSVKAMPVANRKLSSDISIHFFLLVCFRQKNHCFSVVNSLLLIINRCQRVHICTQKIFKEWTKMFLVKFALPYLAVKQRYTHMSKKNAVDRDWAWMRLRHTTWAVSEAATVQLWTAFFTLRWKQNLFLQHPQPIFFLAVQDQNEWHELMKNAEMQTSERGRKKKTIEDSTTNRWGNGKDSSSHAAKVVRKRKTSLRPHT